MNSTETSDSFKNSSSGPAVDNAPELPNQEAAPFHSKRPLEDAEDTTADVKRVRELDSSEASTRQDQSKIPSDELPEGVSSVPTANSVTECPPTHNGVNIPPPQPILTGGD